MNFPTFNIPDEPAGAPLGSSLHAVLLDKFSLGYQLLGHLSPGLLQHGQLLLQDPLLLLQLGDPGQQSLILLGQVVGRVLGILIIDDAIAAN